MTSYTGPWVMAFNPGVSVGAIEAMRTRCPHIYFLDTVRFMDEKKVDTTVRRSVIGSRVDSAKTSFIEENYESPDLMLASLDAMLFSPDCLVCGAKQKGTVLFYRAPNEDDKKLGGDGVILAYSVCDSLLCRHKMRQRVKREAKGKRMSLTLLHRRKCDVCKKITDSVRVCAGCQLKRYCGKECQKADWKTHKPDCLECRV